MRGAVPLLAVLTLLGVATPSETTARNRNRESVGVFGTINGKKFKATSRQGVGDPCVNGIYDQAQGTVVFVAIECKGRRRRQGVAVKRNYQTLVMACTSFTPGAVPPYEIPCPGSGYSEAKTGRFGIPKSMATWGANFDFTDIFNPTSNVRMRVEGFDGTNLRGTIFGVFEEPLAGDAFPPAEISGEVRFDFPIEVH
jgi:hypothetical protein